MSKAKNKTTKNVKSPAAFIKTVSPDEKQEDCKRVMKMMEDATGLAPKMWGGSIIGFGEYHYKYESGREGNYFRVGFSPRVQNLTIYIMPGYQDFDDELSRLGKHKIGKSCLYIKRLSDVDETVLRELIDKGLRLLEETHPS